ncbi:hypothetical protein V8E51_001619 [Hyaloscypha variabilis]|uniref:Uncharacterized protein n=1 Tax=Hyaloscypha variabilis (strain UAMH 11265 / GT02V1 / F) TaxID=1149755 RepID=A0A2J6R437_HYAVF|nr:hypothetical protein L207DRAFT_589645 [Hyaloscypha variabilis F]
MSTSHHGQHHAQKGKNNKGKKPSPPPTYTCIFKELGLANLKHCHKTVTSCNAACAYCRGMFEQVYHGIISDDQQHWTPFIPLQMKGEEAINSPVREPEYVKKSDGRNA